MPDAPFDAALFCDGRVRALAAADKTDYRQMLNLSSNEADLAGLRALLQRYLQEAPDTVGARYPYWPALAAEAARFYGVTPAAIVLDAGSDSAIRMLMAMLGKTCGRVVLQEPNYAGYRRYAALAGCEVVALRTPGDQWGHRIAANAAPLLSGQAPSVVVVTSPNGHTGTALPPAEMAALCDLCAAGGHMLLIDEAYAPLAALRHHALLRYPGTVILRSFSKNCGMAGQRLGMVVADPAIAAYLRCWSGVNAVSGIAVGHAAFCMRHADDVAAQRAAMEAARARFAADIGALFPHWRHAESDANFVLFETPGPAVADAAAAHLLADRIVVKRFPDGPPGLRGCLRIGIADPAPMAAVLHSLRAFAAAGRATALTVTPAPLHGAALAVGGYKHATVGLIALCLALGRRARLANVPDVEDVRVLARIIRSGGGHAVWEAGVLTLDTGGFHCTEVPESESRKVHGALYLMPVLLGRFGRVRLGASGGCQLDGSGIGAGRPVQHMLSVLACFGASFSAGQNTIDGTCARLTACDIDCMDYSERTDLLTGPLVSGATKTAILAAACTASGQTRIRHYYAKPDVLELLAFLAEAGFAVQFDGADVLIAPPEGAARAPDAPLRHQVVSCLSEVITYVALAQHGQVALRLLGLTVARVRAGLAAELALLDAMGVALTWGPDCLDIQPAARLRACDIDVTSVGIYSDHQPFFALMLLRGDRPARIREFVWRGRFSYARQLARLGARIEVGEGAVTIFPSTLDRAGQSLDADDLRAAAVLLLAALVVPGVTRVRGAWHLERGYPDLPGALRLAGACLAGEPEDA